MGFNPMDEEELDPATGLPGMVSAPPALAPPALALPPDDQAPPPALAAGPPPDMNPAVKDYLMQKYSLGDRQKLVDENNGYDTTGAIAGALASLGAGFQGKDSLAAANQVMNQRREVKKDRLADFDKNRAVSLEDEQLNPDSDSSKRFRATLKANFPEIAEKYGSAFDSLTAADQKAVFQVAETKAKIEGAAAQRSAADEAKKRGDQMRQEMQDEKRKQQLSAQDDKDAKALQKHLGAGWLARSGQAGAVQGKINAAEAAEKLIEQGKTQPGGLDSRQYEELALSTNKLLNPGGGGGASARIEALVPHTFWGSKQTLQEYLSNHPQGQDFQKFTERLGDTIQREKDLAQNQKRQFQVEGLAAHSRLKRSNPELYNQLLDSNGLDPNMINEKGQYQAPKTIIKTQTNAKTGEKRVVYSDGSTEIMGANNIADGRK